MTYEDEQTREEFHLLAASEQIEWMEFENALAEKGHSLHVSDVTVVGSQSSVCISIVRGNVR